MFQVTLYKEVIYEGPVCPKGGVESFESTLVNYYGHYKNNILPFSGGLLDQPAILGPAMNIIDQVYSEYGQRPRSRN